MQATMSNLEQDSTYTGPIEISTFDIREAWSSGSVDHQATPRQESLISSVERALSEGLYYTDEVRGHVARDLEINPIELEKQNPGLRKVDGGLFSMDVYHARNLLRHRQLVLANQRAVLRFGLHAGMKIGKAKINGKIMMAAFIVEVDGKQLKLEGRMGSKKVVVTLQAKDIAVMAGMAGNPIFVGQEVGDEELIKQKA